MDHVEGAGRAHSYKLARKYSCQVRKSRASTTIAGILPMNVGDFSQVCREQGLFE